jgi:hypothetical protein
MKLHMKVKIIPTKKLAMLSAAFCAVTLAFSHNASALTIGDSQELGFVDPGLPAGDANRTLFVNTMIGLALGGSTHVIIGPHDNLITRSNNDFGTLPTAVFALNGSTTTIDLGTGLYSYLYAKYDGPNFGAEVWYVGNLSGIITIPATGGGYGLSGWTLFGPGGVQVPDGGITVMLLGAALGALGMAQRFLMS